MTIKKGQILNPTGKGGFGDNPQNRADGRWRAEDSIPYWQHYFLSLTIDQVEEWLTKNPYEHRTNAQIIALDSIQKAAKKIEYLKEVTDRTTGKPKQSVDVTTDGEKISSPQIITTLTPDQLSEYLKK